MVAYLVQVMFAVQGDRANAVSLSLLWRKPSSMAFEGDGDPVAGTIRTPAGILRLKDGRLLTNVSKAVPNEELSIRALTANGLRESNSASWQRLVTLARSSIWFKTVKQPLLAEIRSNDGEVLKSLRVQSIFGDSYFTLDPLKRWLLASSMIEHTGRETHVQELFFLPLKRSPLRFVRYWDLSKMPSKALGVPLEQGMGIAQAGFVPYTPDSSLCCGNPQTGKVLWKNGGHGPGWWLGAKHVLAANPWSLLDAASGREFESNAPTLLNGVHPAQVRVIGDFVLANQTTLTGSIETVCYQISLPSKSVGRKATIR